MASDAENVSIWFGQTSDSLKTALTRPNGRAFTVFRKFLGGNDREISGVHYSGMPADEPAHLSGIACGEGAVLCD